MRSLNDDRVLYDEDYIKDMETRNNLLSRENEILAVNFQQVSKNLHDYQLNYNDKYKESVEKILQFDQVNSELYKTKEVLDKVILKSQYSDQKVNEMIEKLAKVEFFNEGLVYENERLNNEISNLNSTIAMYKNLVTDVVDKMPILNNQDQEYGYINMGNN